LRQLTASFKSIVLSGEFFINETNFSVKTPSELSCLDFDLSLPLEGKLIKKWEKYSELGKKKAGKCNKI
jgi:hypothetical protein